MKMKTKRKLKICFKRFMAFVTLLCFSVSQAASAGIANPSIVMAQGQQSSNRGDVMIPSLAEVLELPKELGSIQERFVPAGNQVTPLVIHIQDAHASLDAQESIRKILDHLQKNYGIETIFLEGVMSEVDPELLQFFKDPALNQQLAGRLLKEGLIGGTEQHLLSRLLDDRQHIVAYGVEDIALYRKNLEDFREVYQGNTQAQPFLSDMKAKIMTLSSHFFSPSLRRFFKQWYSFQDTPAELMRRMPTLEKYAREALNVNLVEASSQRDWPQLTRFFNLKRLEPKIKRRTVLKEYKKLKTQMIEASVSEQEIEKLAPYMKVSDASVSPRRQLESFYDNVKEASPDASFSFEAYPNLSLYWGTRILAHEMNATLLFQEMNNLSEQVIEKLGNPESRELLGIYRQFVLVKKLMSLELSDAEHEIVAAQQAELFPSRLIERIQQLHLQVPNAKGEALAFQHKTPESLFKTAIQFYAGAKKRDEVIFQTMIAKMKSLGRENAVLITGGFHSSGLLKQLKENDVSFVEVMPSIRDLTKETNYWNTMNLKGSYETESSYANHPSVADGGITFLAGVLPDDAQHMLSVLQYEVADVAADWGMTSAEAFQEVNASPAGRGHAPVGSTFYPDDEPIISLGVVARSEARKKRKGMKHRGLLLTGAAVTAAAVGGFVVSDRINESGTQPDPAAQAQQEKIERDTLKAEIAAELKAELEKDVDAKVTEAVAHRALLEKAEKEYGLKLEDLRGLSNEKILEKILEKKLEIKGQTRAVEIARENGIHHKDDLDIFRQNPKKRQEMLDAMHTQRQRAIELGQDLSDFKGTIAELKTRNDAIAAYRKLEGRAEEGHLVGTDLEGLTKDNIEARILVVKKLRDDIETELKKAGATQLEIDAALANKTKAQLDVYLGAVKVFGKNPLFLDDLDFKTLQGVLADLTVDQLRHLVSPPHYQEMLDKVLAPTEVFQHATVKDLARDQALDYKLLTEKLDQVAAALGFPKDNDKVFNSVDWYLAWNKYFEINGISSDRAEKFLGYVLTEIPLRIAFYKKNGVTGKLISDYNKQPAKSFSYRWQAVSDMFMPPDQWEEHELISTMDLPVRLVLGAAIERARGWARAGINNIVWENHPQGRDALDAIEYYEIQRSLRLAWLRDPKDPRIQDRLEEIGDWDKGAYETIQMEKIHKARTKEASALAIFSNLLSVDEGFQAAANRNVYAKLLEPHVANWQYPLRLAKPLRNLRGITRPSANIPIQLVSVFTKLAAEQHNLETRITEIARRLTRERLEMQVGDKRSLNLATTLLVTQVTQPALWKTQNPRNFSDIFDGPGMAQNVDYMMRLRESGLVWELYRPELGDFLIKFMNDHEGKGGDIPVANREYQLTQNPVIEWNKTTKPYVDHLADEIEAHMQHFPPEVTSLFRNTLEQYRWLKKNKKTVKGAGLQNYADGEFYLAVSDIMQGWALSLPMLEIADGKKIKLKKYEDYEQRVRIKIELRRATEALEGRQLELFLNPIDGGELSSQANDLVRLGIDPKPYAVISKLFRMAKVQAEALPVWQSIMRDDLKAFDTRSRKTGSLHKAFLRWWAGYGSAEKAKQWTDIMNDDAKREIIIKFAGRAREIHTKGREKKFGINHLENMGRRDNYFSYLLPEIEGFLDTRKDWDQWVKERNVTLDVLDADRPKRAPARSEVRKLTALAALAVATAVGFGIRDADIDPFELNLDKVVQSVTGEVEPTDPAVQAEQEAAAKKAMEEEIAGQVLKLAKQLEAETAVKLDAELEKIQAKADEELATKIAELEKQLKAPVVPDEAAKKAMEAEIADAIQKAKEQSARETTAELEKLEKRLNAEAAAKLKELETGRVRAEKQATLKHAAELKKIQAASDLKAAEELAALEKATAAQVDQKVAEELAALKKREEAKLAQEAEKVRLENLKKLPWTLLSDKELAEMGDIAVDTTQKPILKTTRGTTYIAGFSLKWGKYNFEVSLQDGSVLQPGRGAKPLEYDIFYKHGSKQVKVAGLHVLLLNGVFHSSYVYLPRADASLAKKPPYWRSLQDWQRGMRQGQASWNASHPIFQQRSETRVIPDSGLEPLGQPAVGVANARTIVDSIMSRPRERTLRLTRTRLQAIKAITQSDEADFHLEELKDADTYSVNETLRAEIFVRESVGIFEPTNTHRVEITQERLARVITGADAMGLIDEFNGATRALERIRDKVTEEHIVDAEALIDEITGRFSYLRSEARDKREDEIEGIFGMIVWVDEENGVQITEKSMIIVRRPYADYEGHDEVAVGGGTSADVAGYQVSYRPKFGSEVIGREKEIYVRKQRRSEARFEPVTDYFDAYGTTEAAVLSVSDAVTQNIISEDHRVNPEVFQVLVDIVAPIFAEREGKTVDQVRAEIAQSFKELRPLIADETIPVDSGGVVIISSTSAVSHEGVASIYVSYLLELAGINPEQEIIIAGVNAGAIKDAIFAKDNPFLNAAAKNRVAEAVTLQPAHRPLDQVITQTVRKEALKRAVAAQTTQEDAESLATVVNEVLNFIDDGADSSKLSTVVKAEALFVRTMVILDVLASLERPVTAAQLNVKETRDEVLRNIKAALIKRLPAIKNEIVIGKNGSIVLSLNQIGIQIKAWKAIAKAA